mmetsp:Transcript_10185/g.23988  ORF Transcript_10185/g.23988 Transcript_10185/m.23988 type:complete len:248 (-) Transcript_10185:78-821(-)
MTRRDLGQQPPHGLVFRHRQHSIPEPLPGRESHLVAQTLDDLGPGVHNAIETLQDSDFVVGLDLRPAFLGCWGLWQGFRPCKVDPKDAGFFLPIGHQQQAGPGAVVPGHEFGHSHGVPQVPQPLVQRLRDSKCRGNAACSPGKGLEAMVHIVLFRLKACGAINAEPEGAPLASVPTTVARDGPQLRVSLTLHGRALLRGMRLQVSVPISALLLAIAIAWAAKLDVHDLCVMEVVQEVAHGDEPPLLT